MVVWAVLAALVGLKGIQYVAKVSTFMPLVTLVIMLMLLAKTAGSIGSFDAQKFVDLQKSLSPKGPEALSAIGVLVFVMTYVVGFFATAGAAGADFGTNSRNKNDVQMGGLVGIALGIVVTVGISILLVAGTYASPEFRDAAVAAAKANHPPTPSLVLVSSVLVPTHGRYAAEAIFPPGAGRLSGFMLLLVYCRQQLQNHHAQRQSVHFLRH